MKNVCLSIETSFWPFCHLIVLAQISSIRDVPLSLRCYSIFRTTYVECLGRYHSTKEERKETQWDFFVPSSPGLILLQFLFALSSFDWVARLRSVVFFYSIELHAAFVRRYSTDRWQWKRGYFVLVCPFHGHEGEFHVDILQLVFPIFRILCQRNGGKLRWCAFQISTNLM